MAAGKRYTLKTKAISLCVYYTKWLREKYSTESKFRWIDLKNCTIYPYPILEELESIDLLKFKQKNFFQKFFLKLLINWKKLTFLKMIFSRHFLRMLFNFSF